LAAARAAAATRDPWRNAKTKGKRSGNPIALCSEQEWPKSQVLLFNAFEVLKPESKRSVHFCPEVET
jgi:hypothetical protein